MSMIQLNPPIPVSTSKGDGLAHVLIDYGTEFHLMWVVFIDDTRECWTVPNPEVRIQGNWSLGRRKNENEHQDIREGVGG